MAQPPASQGDTVKVHYTGKLEDGSVFDSSKGKEPMEFTIGDGSLIPAFEEAVIRLKMGESVTKVIPATLVIRVRQMRAQARSRS